MKLCAFFGILQNSRDLDRPCPVNIVETLGVDQFMEDSLLHFGVGIYDFVVIGNGRPLLGVLGDHVKVIVLADDLSRNDCSCLWVSDSFAHPIEKAFVVFGVHHYKGDIRLGQFFRILFLVIVAYHFFDEMLFYTDYLIPGNGILQNDDLFWVLLVSGVEELDGLQV